MSDYILIYLISHYPSSSSPFDIFVIREHVQQQYRCLWCHMYFNSPFLSFHRGEKRRLRLKIPEEMGLKLYNMYLFPAGGDNGAVDKRVHAHQNERTQSFIVQNCVLRLHNSVHACTMVCDGDKLKPFSNKYLQYIQYIKVYMVEQIIILIL